MQVLMKAILAIPRASVRGCLVVAAVSLVAVGCGGGGTTKTVTATTSAATTPPSAPTPGQASGWRHSASKSTHKRRSSPHPVSLPTHTMCDANIRVKTATTTCRFGENTFVVYWTHQQYPDFALSAYSPAADRNYDLDCTPGEGAVVCTAGDGSEVSFSQSSVDAYTLQEAKHYVATTDVGDNVFPWDGEGSGDQSRAQGRGSTPGPSYTAPDPDSAPSKPEPDFPVPDTTPSVPDTSSTPPGANIPNYANGRGSRVQCADGTYSHSGGIQGACSYHGGVG
jgi:hypothetical protein